MKGNSFLVYLTRTHVKINGRVEANCIANSSYWFDLLKIPQEAGLYQLTLSNAGGTPFDLHLRNNNNQLLLRFKTIGMLIKQDLLAAMPKQGYVTVRRIK